MKGIATLTLAALMTVGILAKGTPTTPQQSPQPSADATVQKQGMTHPKHAKKATAHQKGMTSKANSAKQTTTPTPSPTPTK